MPRPEDVRRSGIGDSKYVAWNFFPWRLAKGTIEYREPPHVTKFADAKYWIQMTLHLCHKALIRRD